MTFTPEVLTKIDSNNSINETSSVNYAGSPTNTTGYNSIIITIESNYDSMPGGIQIQFSENNLTSSPDSFETFYTDTYFTGVKFTKVYPILKTYWRIIYDGSSSSAPFELNINSRLSTDSPNSKNNSLSAFDNSIESFIDAFGKVRVSSPQTLLDIRFPGQSQGTTNFLDNNLQISTASSTYTGAYSNSKLKISATGTGYYVSQSRNYCVYQPGKSLLFLASGILYPGDNAYTTRIGYFDNNTPLTSNLTVKNGLYFEHSNGIYSVNIKNNLLTTIVQEDWNIDKMDGTGTSGLNLDFSNTQLFVMDMEWLGVGRIRFGFYAYGKINYCHQVTNINLLLEPYTNSINLPICYSIHSTTGTNPANNFTQICSTVISEGGYNPSGRAFSVSTGANNISIAPGNTERILIAIRGDSTSSSSTRNYYHQTILPTSISIISASTNDLILFKLRLYRDQANFYSGTAPTWTNVDSNSVVEYGIWANGSTGGTLDNTSNSIIVDTDYFFGRGVNSFNSLSNTFNTTVLQLTQNVLGTADVLVLTCEKINSGSTSIYGVIGWQEIY